MNSIKARDYFPAVKWGAKWYPEDLAGMGDFPAESFGGKTYYVDYEHGDDTSGDGSINSPVKQVNQAITLSNAWKDAEVMASGDLGYFRRNKIYIRPWGAAATAVGNYDPITVVPQHVDIIGAPASILSNGSGIVSIGSATDATAALTVASAGMRGVNFYNIQFLGGGTATNVLTSTGTIMRSGFFNCSFYSLPSTNAHIGTTGHWAGNTMRECHFAHNLTSPCALYNFTMTTGVFTDNLFIDNVFNWASTANVNIGATSLSHGTIFKHNVFGQGGTPTDSYCDTSLDGGVFMAENYFDADATDPLQRTVSGNDAGNIKGKTLITATE